MFTSYWPNYKPCAPNGKWRGGSGAQEVASEDRQQEVAANWRRTSTEEERWSFTGWLKEKSNSYRVTLTAERITLHPRLFKTSNDCSKGVVPSRCKTRGSSTDKTTQVWKQQKELHKQNIQRRLKRICSIKETLYTRTEANYSVQTKIKSFKPTASVQTWTRLPLLVFADHLQMSILFILTPCGLFSLD